ncbi:uncharacterized protein LOC143461543 [Clavelina lepadiformis]|uniref:uncharacterized protein LOC143461543 n=1 Tax=Clavelina lepadiformis TaxID=159417 RepID=UPI0040425EF7
MFNTLSNVQLLAKLFLGFCIIIALMEPCAYCCPYHDRLEELERQRNELLSMEASNSPRIQRQLLNIEQEAKAIRRFLGMLEANRDAPKHHHSSHGGVIKPTTTSRRGQNNPESARRLTYNTNTGHAVYQTSNNNLYTAAGQPRNYYHQIDSKKYVACRNSQYHVCPVGSSCIYEYGTYRCIKRRIRECGTGFRKQIISARRFKCVDINECANASLNNCEQICQNFMGGFRCDCNPGFRRSDNGTCNDIDECVLHENPCQYKCVNSNGSYNCICPDGYNIVSKVRCKDIDECLNDTICLENQECLNTYGGYECNQQEPCEPGYQRRNTSEIPFGPCEIHNYASALDKPTIVSQNRFSLHSNYPANTEVGRLRFAPKRDHIYTFRVVQGEKNFRMVPKRRHGYVSIRTRTKLVGPETYQLKILVSNSVSHTKSRVDLSFVVSSYGF